MRTAGADAEVQAQQVDNVLRTAEVGRRADLNRGGSTTAYGPLVVIETPTRASAPAWLGRAQPLGAMLCRWLNHRYAKRCERDALLRGEHPYVPEGSLRAHASAHAREQSARLRASRAWGSRGDVHVFYLDRGVCRHMREALHELNCAPPPQHVEFRTLNPRRSWVPSRAELRIFATNPPPL